MKRTIKFRGKRLDNGEWLYGDLMHDNAGGCYVYPIESENLFKENKVNSDTVGQFTGLIDKNGKEIYEGDIILSQKCNCRAILHKVDYNEDNAMFVAKPTHGWDFDFCQISKYWIDKYGKEVIGNIHDNPELLK